MTQASREVAGPADPTVCTVSGRPLRALFWAVGALVVAIALALSFPSWRAGLPYEWSLAASYLLTWGPLVIALAATAVFWRRFLAFRPADIYLGFAIGVIGRAVGIVVDYLMTGRMPGGGVILGGVSGVYVFTAVIAPVVLAPLIEEPFFRGLLQGSLDRVARPWPSLVLTSAVFAAVHTIADGWSVSLIVTLLAYALLAGYVTQRTRRIGGAVIGHAVFNGIAALMSWPW